MSMDECTTHRVGGERFFVGDCVKQTENVMYKTNKPGSNGVRGFLWEKVGGGKR